MKFEIPVTKEDIANGKTGATECPVALAAQRYFKRPEILVTNRWLFFGTDSFFSDQPSLLADGMTRFWINRFDETAGVMQPFIAKYRTQSAWNRFITKLGF